MLLSDSFLELADAADEAVSAARDNLQAAYDAEAESLTSLKEKFEDFSSSLADFKNTLITGDMSTASNAEKYATQQALYESTKAAALGGDTTAIGEFESVATDFLKLSKEMFASGEGYSANFADVLAATTALESFTASQVDVSQASLDALNLQVDGLITLNESTLSVAQAIYELQAAMGLGIVAATGVDGSHADGLSFVPFDGYTAELHKGEAVLTAQENKAYQQGSSNSNAGLVEELRSLRAQVASLQSTVQEQTGALVVATYDAQEQNAQAVVAGTQDAMSASVYTQRVKGTLA